MVYDVVYSASATAEYCAIMQCHVWVITFAYINWLCGYVATMLFVASSQLYFDLKPRMWHTADAHHKGTGGCETDVILFGGNVRRKSNSEKHVVTGLSIFTFGKSMTQKLPNQAWFILFLPRKCIKKGIPFRYCNVLFFSMETTVLL